MMQDGRTSYRDTVFRVAEIVRSVSSSVIAELDISEEDKGTRDLVTTIDQAIEARLVSALASIVPGASVRGEEGAERRDKSPNRGSEWVIDPIDGTVNFARQVDIYTSVISLLVDGEPQACVVHRPTAGITMLAVREHGCYELGPNWKRGSGRAVAVKPQPLSRSLGSVMITPKLGSASRAASLAFAEWTLENTLGFRVFVSQAYEGATLASGGLNFVVTFESLGGWTADAAKLMCREAGGVVGVLNSRGHERVCGFALVASLDLLEGLRPGFASVGYDVGAAS